MIALQRPPYKFARFCAWGSAILFVSFGVVWGMTTKNSPWVWAPMVGIVGAVGAIALTWTLREISNVQAQTENPNAQNPPSTQSSGPAINTYNQSGGTNIINVGPSKLTFTSDIREQLVRMLPKGKPIRIMSVGSASDQAIADQFQEFLLSRGYKISQRERIGILAPPPDQKIAVMNTPSEVVILIAPSA